MVRVLDLGADISFERGVASQDAAFDAIHKEDRDETLILLEHAPVFTLGRSANADHILWNDSQRAERGIACVQTTRGGDVTYHGPGQLTGYPIINLRARNLGLLEYIEKIEEMIIRVCADFGVAAARDARNHGVWCGDNKIAALGIRVTHGITRHGFALNVNPDLSHYCGIIACGLSDAGVTSLSRELARPLEVAEVKPVLVARFRELFA